MKIRKEEMARHEHLSQQRIDRYFNDNKQRIADLLCTAFEGGSNYWYFIHQNNRKELNLDYLHEVPLHPDGFLMIGEKDNWDFESEVFVNKKRVLRLDLAALQHGFERFRKDYPQHFEDWVQDNGDAGTADIFLQVVVFGTDIYG